MKKRITQLSQMNSVIEVPGPGEPLRVRQTEVPAAPDKGLVLKTHFAGICHSDLHLVHNKIRLSDSVVVGIEAINPAFKWPHTPGHEFCGEVYQLGSDAASSGLRVGDRICVFPYVGCGSCGYCNIGKNIHCAVSLAVDYGIGTSGGWQSYFPVHHTKHVLKIPDSFPMETAGVIGCSGITSYSGIKKALPVLELAMQCKGTASVLVIGAGGLGLWCISLGKAMFPSGTKIYVADIDEEKLQVARDMGADDTVLWPRDMSEEEAVETTRQLTGGVDVSMDFVGLSSTATKGLKLLNKSGRLVLIGLAGGDLRLSVVDITLGCKSVVGLYAGEFDDFKQLIQLVHDKQVRPPPITCVTPEGANDALEKLAKGQVTGRCLIKFL